MKNNFWLSFLVVSSFLLLNCLAQNSDKNIIDVTSNKTVQNRQLPIHVKLFGVSLKGSWEKTQYSFKMLAVPNYTATTNIKQNNHPPYVRPSEDDKQQQKPLRKQQKTSRQFITFVKSTSGRAQVLITQTNQVSPRPYVYIQLLNSTYLNQRVIQFSFVLERGYNRTLDQWKTKKFLTAVQMFENFKQIATFEIQLNFIMRKSDQTVIIELKSDSIDVVLSLSPIGYGKSYFLQLLTINILQIVLLLCFGKNQVILGNTSEWLILQSCLFIVLQSIFIFKLALGYYDTSLSLLFMNFVLNVSVMMLILWKFSPVIQKFRAKTHFFFCLVFIILYFYNSYHYYHTGIFWVLEFGVLFMWQIAYSVSRGGQGGVSMQLVLVVILSRLPVLVTMMSKENIFKMKPDFSASKLIIGCLAMHLVVIYLQKRYGGRFFVPVAIIPDFFDYLRTAIFDSQVAKKECSICLNRLRQKPNTIQGNQQQQTKQVELRKSERISYVLTECDHCFHQSCLSDWLKVHLVCPNCKTSLPPMNLGSHSYS